MDNRRAGDPAEDLADREERAAQRREGAHEHHAERDGGVEEAARDAEKDPGVDGEREAEREGNVEQVGRVDGRYLRVVLPLGGLAGEGGGGCEGCGLALGARSRVR